MAAPVTPSAGPGRESTGRGGRPPGLDVLVAGVLLETVLLVLAAVAVVVELVRGGSSSVAVSGFLVVFFLGVAWVLVTCVRALRRSKRSGRAPVAVWQLLQGLVGISLLTSGALWAVISGVALLLVAVTVLVLLMTKPVIEATQD
jgi:hypothetical protein